MNWIWVGISSEGADVKPRHGFKRLQEASRYSWAGLRSAFIHEESFRLELALCCILAPVGMWLGRSGLERALLVGSLALVLIVEMLNSSIEAAVDRIGDQRHELAGRAKDMGSAAVFLALVNVILVWMFIIIDRI